MDLEDCQACLSVRPRDRDLPVEAACPHERRVQQRSAVGGGHEHNSLCGLEAVYLSEQLVESLQTASKQITNNLELLIPRWNA
jgi:hypothetical protein